MSDDYSKPTLELVGQDGNAFAIIGAARKAGKKAGWDDKNLSSMVEEMMSGDYDHLLQVAMEHFEVE